jgi:hypothetical protein
MPFLGKTPTKFLDANVNIDGGNIDGTTIGATSTAPATVSTFTSTGIDDNATSTKLTVSNTGIDVTGTVTADSTITINNDGGSSFSHSRIILDSNGASRAAGIFSHNQVNDTEWFFGNPYDTPDSFAINRQATASHDDSTSNKTNSLVTVNSSGNVGIGTTSPSFPLEVDGGTGDGVKIKAGNTSNDDSFLIANSSNTTMFLVDGGGNVGIGTTSPQKPLHVKLATNENVVLQTGGGGDARISAINDAFSATTQFSVQGDPLLFRTAGGGEMARIDSSGNLLVGKSSTSTTTAGGEINADGTLVGVRDGGNPLVLNRLSSDGTIASFRKDGTTVGSIGVLSSNNVYFGGSVSGHAGLIMDGSSIVPLSALTRTDNAIDLGDGSYRFDDIYATNGTINTSDANEKQDIEALSEAETRVAVAAKGLLRKFRWKSAVEEKGDDARIHFGIIAQDLQSAFEAEGLDAGDYGMFIHSTWTDEETGEERSRMGVRYLELLAFIIAAI